MRKVVAVVGPTGSGKTSLSVELAQKFNGEIISGDSIQVYRGLDIGSAKVTPEEMQGVPHYLIDTLDLNENYNVRDFQIACREYIEKISEDNKLPIIAGGTGLYIKAALYDYEFPEETEEEETDKYSDYSNEDLWNLLNQKDEKTAQTIHQNNRKRVLRALKMVEEGKSRSEILAEQKHEPVYDIYLIGLTMERQYLYERINKRVEIMMQNGLLKEVEDLYKKDSQLFERRGMQGIGYREWKAYFDNEMTEDEIVSEIQKHSRQFAKRQYTWFNNQMDIHWYDITDPEFKNKVLSELKIWLEEQQ